MANADFLVSPPDVLQLYQCTTQGAVFFLGSLWQDAAFAASHSMGPVDSCSKPYKSMMWKVNVDLVRITDACPCSVSILPSKTTRSDAGVGMFTARAFKKGAVIGSYHETLVYHDLSSR